MMRTLKGMCSLEGAWEKRRTAGGIAMRIESQARHTRFVVNVLQIPTPVRSTAVLTRIISHEVMVHRQGISRQRLQLWRVSTFSGEKFLSSSPQCGLFCLALHFGMLYGICLVAGGVPNGNKKEGTLDRKSGVKS